MATALLCLTTASCATVPLERPAAPPENLSAGLQYAAVYLSAGKCVGEFRSKDGTTVRPPLPRAFCDVTRASIRPPEPATNGAR
jgi:hypothetical protein